MVKFDDSIKMAADETMMKRVKDLGRKQNTMNGLTAFHPDKSHYKHHLSNK